MVEIYVKAHAAIVVDEVKCRRCGIPTDLSASELYYRLFYAKRHGIRFPSAWFGRCIVDGTPWPPLSRAERVRATPVLPGDGLTKEERMAICLECPQRTDEGCALVGELRMACNWGLSAHEHQQMLLTEGATYGLKTCPAGRFAAASMAS